MLRAVDTEKKNFVISTSSAIFLVYDLKILCNINGNDNNCIYPSLITCQVLFIN